MNKHQSGIALIAAIFLVVVIGAALVLLATLSLRNSQQTTQNLLQTRSQLAANAGIEWIIQSLIVNGSAAPCASVTAPPATATTLALAAYPSMTVIVSCDFTTFNRPSQLKTLYRITATAEFGTINEPDYAWAEVEATIEL